MMTKTVVLDDDPTGTQSASDVAILLEWDSGSLLEALTRDDAVYLQTNSRALSESTAVDLARRIRGEVELVSEELGVDVSVVLRGDSTLRGHVFPEADVFARGEAPILFVPAFPAGGRVTIDGTHYVTVHGDRIPAGETEYAQDPVFHYVSSSLVDYSMEKGHRRGIPVPLNALRESRGGILTDALLNARGNEVVVPDAETDHDIELIADGLRSAKRKGARIVTRGGAPIAAILSGKASKGYLPQRYIASGPVLVVCGSHTSGASDQLEALQAATGWRPVVVRTEACLDDSHAEGERAAEEVVRALTTEGGAILCSERVRRSGDDTLEHGASVMRALTTATRAVEGHVQTVVAKGGITSADVTRFGLEARSATVRGQVDAGVSVWDLVTELRPASLVVVPGNVGASNVLVRILDRLEVVA